MTQAQEYVNQNCFDKKVKVLSLEAQDLEGYLDLSEFSNLEELDCSCNELTGLNLSKCTNLSKLNCSINLFDDLDFLTKLPNPDKLIYLNIDDCGIDLSQGKIIKILQSFTNLENMKISLEDQEFRAKVTNLKDENQLLRDQLDKEIKEISNQQKKNQELEAQLQTSKGKISEQAEIIANLQNELKAEKSIKKALNRFQKELTNNLIEKALIEERIRVTKKKIAELRENKEKLAARQLQKLEGELVDWDKQLKAKQKNEQDLEAKIELLRQGPKSLEEEIEKKINEVKQKLKPNNTEERKLLEEVSENCKHLLNLQIGESKISLIKKGLGPLKTKFLNVRGISHTEVLNIRKLIEEVREKSDKLIDLREMIREVDKIEDEEKKEKEKLIGLQRSSSNKNWESNEQTEQCDLCFECQRPNTGKDWCKTCKARHFEKNFDKWTSGSSEIDKFIQESQLKALNLWQVLEWIPYDQFINVEHLAEGGFSKVYKAKWKNKEIALKILNSSQNMTADFLREITCHKLLNKEMRLVECYGISRELQGGNYVMVMQYVPAGNLRQYLQKNYSKLNWENKLFQLKTVAQGLKNIHEQKLVHRDFHPGNILVDESNSLAWGNITDLGLCRPAQEKDKEGKSYGVLPYVAPEVLNGESYIKEADIYSFGMVIYEVLSGLPPYYDRTHDISLATEICDGEQLLRPEFKIKIPQLLEDLVKKCWDIDPAKRPTAQQIEEHLLMWRSELKENKDTEFVQQVKEAEEFNKNLPAPTKIVLDPRKYVSKPLPIQVFKKFHASKNLGLGSVGTELEKEIEQIEKIISLSLEGELKELVRNFIQAKKKSLKDEKDDEAGNKVVELKQKLKEKKVSREGINGIIRYCEEVTKSDQQIKEVQAKVVEILPKKNY